MTIGEFRAACEGYRMRLESWQKMTDNLNHTLGRYIGIAFNSPKDYPKEPALSKTENHHLATTSSDAARERQARLKYKKG